MNNSRVTIKDIAELAKVSIATVSKVLNNKDQHISEKTRQKVIKVADQIGYIPNSNAQGLKVKNSKTLGIILPDISNAFPEMAKGAEDEAAKHGYCIILCNSNGNKIQEERCIKMLLSKMADGIIYISSHLKESDDKIIASKIPFVAIDREIEIKSSGGLVLINNYEAMVEVAKYMYENNCRRIGHVTSDIRSTPCNDRLKGLTDGLSQVGIEFDESLLYVGDFSVETGYKGAINLIKKDKMIDSIVCGNDLIAVGVMSALQKMGINVPEQVKVIGFDDMLMARYTNPELTTVSQNAYEMGRTASKMLIEHLELGTDLSKVILEHAIIMRNSV